MIKPVSYENTSLWGIDLGGTKLEGIIIPSLHETKPLLRNPYRKQQF
jgi:hypothetical protein